MSGDLTGLCLYIWTKANPNALSMPYNCALFVAHSCLMDIPGWGGGAMLYPAKGRGTLKLWMTGAVEILT